MKVKTSITLTESALATVERRSKQLRTNHSSFIEAAVRVYDSQLSRQELNARDLDIINSNANVLNEEAADALSYQVGE
jgi:NACalpha-BTF3-like transcription factor